MASAKLPSYTRKGGPYDVKSKLRRESRKSPARFSKAAGGGAIRFTPGAGSSAG